MAFVFEGEYRTREDCDHYKRHRLFMLSRLVPSAQSASANPHPTSSSLEGPSPPDYSPRFPPVQARGGAATPGPPTGGASTVGGVGTISPGRACNKARHGRHTLRLEPSFVSSPVSGEGAASRCHQNKVEKRECVEFTKTLSGIVSRLLCSHRPLFSLGVLSGADRSCFALKMRLRERKCHLMESQWLCGQPPLPTAHSRVMLG